MVNVGLQGEIRAKDQQIATLERRYVDYLSDENKNNGISIIAKNNEEEEYPKTPDVTHFLNDFATGPSGSSVSGHRALILKYRQLFCDSSLLNWKSNLTGASFHLHQGAPTGLLLNQYIPRQHAYVCLYADNMVIEVIRSGCCLNIIKVAPYLRMEIHRMSLFRINYSKGMG